MLHIDLKLSVIYYRVLTCQCTINAYSWTGYLVVRGPVESCTVSCPGPGSHAQCIFLMISNIPVVGYVFLIYDNFHVY